MGYLISENKYYKMKYTTYDIELLIIKLIEDIDYYEENQYRIDRYAKEREDCARAQSAYRSAIREIDEAMRYYAWVRD